MRSGEPARTVPPAAGGTFTSTARRAQFVAAAIETIAEVGYSRASLARIAGRVGVSKGVISYHFTGKEELVLAALADIAAKGGAFVYARSMTRPSAPERLRGWIESVLEYPVVHRYEMVAFYEITVGSRGDAAVSAAVAGLSAGVTAALRDMLAEGQDGGEFRADFDPRAVASALMAVVDAVSPRMVHDPDFDVAHYGREIAGLFDAATRAPA